MCDNTAVSWSEQNSYRTSIEIDTKQALAQKLLQYVDIYGKQGYPESFLQGMERALALILVTPKTSVPPAQDPLF